MSPFPSDREIRRGDRPTLPPIRDLFRDELSRSPRPQVPTDPPSLARLSVSDDLYDSTLDEQTPLQSCPPRFATGRPSSSHSRHSFNTTPLPLSYPILQQRPPPSSPFAPPAQLVRTRQSMDYGRPTGRPDTHPFATHHTTHDIRGHRPAGPQPSAPEHSRSRTPAPVGYYPDQPQPGPSYSESARSYAARTHLEQERAAMRAYRPPPGVDSTPRPRTTISTSVDQYHASRQSDDEQTPVARYPVIPAAPPERTASSSRDVAAAAAPSTASGSKYECSYCGKGFNRPSSLKIHLNSHTGEKPFVCPVEGCGRSFSVLSNMRRHARVHTQKELEGSSDSDGQRRPSSSQSAQRSLTTATAGGRSLYARRDSDASSGSSRRSRTSSPDDDDDGRPEKRTRHGKATPTIKP